MDDITLHTCQIENKFYDIKHKKLLFYIDAVNKQWHMRYKLRPCTISILNFSINSRAEAEKNKSND